MLFNFFSKATKKHEQKEENKTAFIIEINDRLCDKSDYGENLSALTEEERVFFIVNELEQEVNNGGFSQYLYNSSGDHAHRAVECLQIVGAVQMGEICRTALAAYGEPIPQDREERQGFLEEYETEKVESILNECDSQFCKYPDDLEELNYRYIMENREKFT